MWINLDDKYEWDTMYFVPRQIPTHMADALPTEDIRAKTKRITINEEVLDLEIDIIPVVKYLNSFEDITTLDSCNGHEFYRTDGIVWKPRLPYVIFSCSNLSLLEKLIGVFNPSKLPHADIIFCGKGFCGKNLWLLKFCHISALKSVNKELENQLQ